MSLHDTGFPDAPVHHHAMTSCMMALALFPIPPSDFHFSPISLYSLRDSCNTCNKLKKNQKKQGLNLLQPCVTALKIL